MVSGFPIVQKQLGAERGWAKAERPIHRVNKRNRSTYGSHAGVLSLRNSQSSGSLRGVRDDVLRRQVEQKVMALIILCFTHLN